MLYESKIIGGALITNLNKMINIKLVELSKKYDVSLIEIQTAKNEKISKVYRIYLKPLNENDEEIKNEFFSKRNLASWLMCQR